MPKLPLDTSIEAEYSDGFILNETDYNDVSPYDETRNIFHAILNKLPEKEHGKMVRFSLFYKNTKYDIDWTDLHESARPVRFRHGFSGINLDSGEVISGFTGVDFGYQYTDEHGSNIKNIMEL